MLKLALKMLADSMSNALTTAQQPPLSGVKERMEKANFFNKMSKAGDITGLGKIQLGKFIASSNKIKFMQKNKVNFAEIYTNLLNEINDHIKV